MRHDAVIERRDRAVVADGAPQARGDEWAQSPVLQVLPARPGQLDRAAGELHRDRDRLPQVVHLGPAAEAAAEERRVQRDPVLGQARGLCRGVPGDGIALGTDPDLECVTRIQGGAVHRLHAFVGEERHLVFRGHPSLCAIDDGLGTTFVADDDVVDLVEQAEIAFTQSFGTHEFDG